jgi:hypothetical protein
MRVAQKDESHKAENKAAVFYMHSPVLKNYSALKSHFCRCGEWRRKRFCSSRQQNSYITENTPRET